MVDHARARRLAEADHADRRRGPGARGQGPAADDGDHHGHAGDGRPARRHRLLHGARARRSTPIPTPRGRRRARQRHRRAALQGRARARASGTRPTLAFVADACPTRRGGWRSCSPAPASRTRRWPAAPSARSTRANPTPTAHRASPRRTTTEHRQFPRSAHARGVGGYAPSGLLDPSRGASWPPTPYGPPPMCSPTPPTSPCWPTCSPTPIRSAARSPSASRCSGAARRCGWPSRRPTTMPETLRPLDVLGLVVPPSAGARRARRRGGVRRRRARPARPARRPAFDAGPRIDHDRPPRHRTPASATSSCSTRTPRPRSSSSTGVLAALGVPARRRRRPLPLRGPRHRHRWASARPGQAAHRLAAELIAAGVEPTTLVRHACSTPTRSRGSPRWPALLDGCVLEPDAAGGFGLVHTAVPAADVARFRPGRDRQRHRHRAHRGRGRGRARAQAGRASAVVGVDAVEGAGRRVAGGGAARRRRAPGGGRVHAATARSARCCPRCAPRSLRTPAARLLGATRGPGKSPSRPPGALRLRCTS